MAPNELKRYIYYHRKTKRELVELLLYVTNQKRLDREYLVSIRYDLQKLSLTVDNCHLLPKSEKMEIISNLRQADDILNFNIDEFDKRRDEE